MMWDAHQKARGEIGSYRIPPWPQKILRYLRQSNGVPLEIVSKVILRHQDLKTTQIYLGKASEHETIQWVDILHGK